MTIIAYCVIAIPRQHLTMHHSFVCSVVGFGLVRLSTCNMFKVHINMNKVLFNMKMIFQGFAAVGVKKCNIIIFLMLLYPKKIAINCHVGKWIFCTVTIAVLLWAVGPNELSKF